MQLRLATFLVVLMVSLPIATFADWQPDGVPLSTAAFQQAIPIAVTDGAGGAIVTWQDLRGGVTEDIYVQRINASGVVQWTVDGVGLCTAADYQLEPRIISDGAGGAIVTWYDNRSGTNDIYAQRISGAGAAQWAANGVAICVAANLQRWPVIVSDGAGGAIIAWYDFRSGTNADVYAQRINALGVVQWAANGVALCSQVSEQDNPMIVSDGAGGAIAAWADYRNVSIDIYAQRINAAGAVQWAANGVALCTAANSQRFPAIASDGAGGAIVTWPDYRTSGFADIYARRISAAGVPQWTPDGVAICVASNDQLSPTIIPDNAGGAIVAWHDARSLSNDIYAQRVSSAGNVMWIGDGVALCTATNEQYLSAIIADGAGGAMVTWTDYRATYSHA